MRKLPSPGLVVACLALAIALGGVSYAAVKIPRNSVGSVQVKNGSLKRIDVAKGQFPLGTEKGVTLVSVPPQSWVQLGGATKTATHFSDGTRFGSAAVDSDVFFGANVEAPLALSGKRTRLLGADICFDVAGANVIVDAVSVAVLHQSGGPATTTSKASFDDETDRDNADCHVFSMPAPVTLDADDLVVLALKIDWPAGGDTFTIGRTTAIFDTSTANAAKPAN